MEKAIKYNSKPTNTYRNLSVAYAHVGRTQEAQAMADKGFEKWPEAMRNLNFYMSIGFFKDPQIMELFAEGALKAGLPGEPSGYYKISKENQLTGPEIKKLFFGRKVTGFNLLTQKKWRIERSKEGKATILYGEGSDRGKSWVEDNMLCDQWDELNEGLKDCWPVFRNPEGIRENNDEYLGTPGYGTYPFSVAE